MTAIPAHRITEQTAADSESYFILHAKPIPELNDR
jgi:hypothetical protein